jgi:hypothetical protein
MEPGENELCSEWVIIPFYRHDFSKISKVIKKLPVNCAQGKIRKQFNVV